MLIWIDAKVYQNVHIIMSSSKQNQQVELYKIEKLLPCKTTNQQNEKATCGMGENIFVS